MNQEELQKDIERLNKLELYFKTKIINATNNSNKFKKEKADINKINLCTIIINHYTKILRAIQETKRAINKIVPTSEQ